MDIKIERYDDFDIAFEVLEETIHYKGRDDDTPFHKASISRRHLESAYKELKKIIFKISEDLSKDLFSTKSKNMPSKMDIEFSLALSNEADFWLIKSKGEGGIKVTLTWESKKDG